jgi:chromosome segregation ATPase
MTDYLRTELKSEIDQLNGNLDRLFDKMESLDTDIKTLAQDTKEIKSDLAGQGKEIASITAYIEHNKVEIEKLHSEDKCLWDHFPAQKEDIKEYVKIIAKQEAAKSKVWLYSNILAWVAAAIALARSFLK